MKTLIRICALLLALYGQQVVAADGSAPSPLRDTLSSRPLQLASGESCESQCQNARNSCVRACSVQWQGSPPPACIDTCNERAVQCKQGCQ